MTGPDSIGTPDEQPQPSPKEGGFALPSWVDAAITRSSEDERPANEQDEPFELLESVEPLDSRESIESLDSPEPAESEELQKPLEPAGSAPTAPQARVSVPASEPAAPDPMGARRSLALPWLLAALLFAAAAAVMAFSIWFKPSR